MIFGTYFLQSKRVASIFRRHIPEEFTELETAESASSHAKPPPLPEFPVEVKSVPNSEEALQNESDASNMFAPSPKFTEAAPLPIPQQKESTETIFGETSNAPADSILGSYADATPSPFEDTDPDAAPTPFGSDTSPPNASLPGQ